MAVGDYVWDAKAVARLRELWAAGKSGSSIAEIMGHGLTRSAILGKAARIGLYRQRQRKSRRVGQTLGRPRKHLTAAEAAEAIGTKQPDTRTMQLRFFGDPVPGRSALDKRQAKLSVFHTIHTRP